MSLRHKNSYGIIGEVLLNSVVNYVSIKKILNMIFSECTVIPYIKISKQF